MGLAAAARLVERGIRPAVFEKGSRVGSAILDWGHVRVFSPWDYNVDAAARSLIDEEGVAAPSSLQAHSPYSRGSGSRLGKATDDTLEACLPRLSVLESFQRFLK